MPIVNHKFKEEIRKISASFDINQKRTFILKYFLNTKLCLQS